VAVLPLDGQPRVVGREEGCHLRVDDERVSRRHLEIATTDDGRWRLTDLGSKNGTTVEGRPVTTAELAGPAWLGLGGLLARFETVSDEEQHTAAESELGRRRAALTLQRRFDPAAGLEPLLERILESVLSMAGAERGFVLLARGDGEFELGASAGLAAPDLAAPTFAGSVGAVERVLAAARPVVCCDASADTLLAERPSIAGGGIRALVCLPLTVLGRLLGAVYADSQRPGRVLTRLDLEILEGLAAHAALALAVARLQLEVAELGDRVPRPSADGGGAIPTWRHLTAGDAGAAAGAAS
jgi:hypothetical protein